MNKRIKLFSLLVLFFTIVLLSNISYCADGSLKASQIVSGKKITVTVTSSKKLGAFTLKASGATAVDGSSDIGAYGNNTISGASASGVTTLGKFIFNVPEKDTKVTLSVSQLATDIDDNDLEITSTSITLKGKKVEETTDKDNTTNKDTDTTDKNTSTTNKDTTTTEKPKEKSNNAYLKTLGVRISDSLAKELGVKTDEYDFSGFSKTKTAYNVTVPKNVESLKVVATAGENGTVKIKGNSGFEVGSNNKITVTVTSENGKTTRTYTIKVTQLAEEEEKPGNLIEDKEEIYLKSLSIDGIELSPKFAKDTYSYTATLSDSNISEVKVNAEANNKRAKIDISGNTNLIEGENTINIVVILEDSTVQTVYQIVVTKEVVDVPMTTTEGNNSGATDLIGKIKNYAGIAIAVIALIIVAVVVLIVLLIRENKKLKEENDEDIVNVKSEEYNVYKNDENEYANNDIPKDNFIESLYNQRNRNFDDEELTEGEKEILEEISKQTEKIFEEKVEGQSVEYTSNEEIMENPLETRKRRRGKGKHSL